MKPQLQQEKQIEETTTYEEITETTTYEAPAATTSTSYEEESYTASTCKWI